MRSRLYFYISLFILLFLTLYLIWKFISFISFNQDAMIDIKMKNCVCTYFRIENNHIFRILDFKDQDMRVICENVDSFHCVNDTLYLFKDQEYYFINPRNDSIVTIDYNKIQQSNLFHFTSVDDFMTNDN